jgi:hypothetical protein
MHSVVSDTAPAGQTDKYGASHALVVFTRAETGCEGRVIKLNDK